MVDLQRGHRPFPFRRVPLFSIGALLVSLTSCSGDAESTGPAAEPVLLVQVTGSGSVNVNQGQVVVTDAQAQASASFATGTVVTLAAEPDPGWRLRSWSGSCSGSATTCSVTMMADRTVSAEFEEIEEVGSGSLGSGGGRIVTVEGTASIQIPPEFMEGAATVSVAESEPEDEAWNTPLSGTGYLFTFNGSPGLDALDPDQDFTIRMKIDTQLPAGDEVAVRVEFPEAPGLRMFAAGMVSTDGSEVEVILASENLLALMSWFESSEVQFRLVPEKFEPEPSSAAPSPDLITRAAGAMTSASGETSGAPAGCYEYPLDRISPSGLGAESRVAIVLVHGWNRTVGNCENFEKVQLKAGPRRWGFDYWDQVYEAVSPDLMGIPFFTFTYPTFLHWQDSGEWLTARLDQLRHSGDFDGVIIIGHSMGGLVAAAAAGNSDGDGFIRAVITLATPYEGSPHAFNNPRLFWKGLNTEGGRSLRPGRLPAELPVSVFDVPFLAYSGTLYEGDQACLLLAYQTPLVPRSSCQQFRPGFPKVPWDEQASFGRFSYRWGAENLCAQYGECLNDGTVGVLSQMGASVPFVTHAAQFLYSHTEMRFGELELRDPADPLFKALIEDIRTYLPARTLTVRRVGNGTVTAQPGTLTFPPGEDVAQMEGAQGARIILGASAEPGWSFHRWDGVYCVAPTGCVVALHSDVEVTAVFVQDGEAPSITTTSLPDATIGVFYSQQIQASGGNMPYAWSMESGSLPSGLTLSSGGAISGNPGSTGTSNFEVRVTSSDGLSSTRTLAIQVAAVEQAPSITTSSLPGGTVGQAYSATLSASGGVAPYTWSLAAGSLPAGLDLATSGTISGTPTSAGTSTVTVRVTGGNGLSGTRSLLLAVQPGSSTPDNLGVGFGDEQFSLIPAGSFQMGSTNGRDNEQPVHTVTLTRSFYMQRTEVTQGQWREIMGTNPSGFSSCGDICPVETVSWNDVQMFLAALNTRYPGRNYRLPTEAEWEYAARAGTTGDYGGSGILDDMGWYSGNSGSHTHPVALKQPNAWGLYDMHGNVLEWVQDRYSGTYYSVSPGVDPTGPTTGEFGVLRGGSWSYDANFARSAFRTVSSLPYRGNFVGFRLVRTP